MRDTADDVKEGFDETGDKIKTGAKVIGNKVKDPNTDLGTEYKGRKIKGRSKTHLDNLHTIISHFSFYRFASALNDNFC